MLYEVITFVGLSIDNAAAVAKFRDEYQVDYPLLIAPTDILELAAQLGNTAQALPFTLIRNNFV